MKAQAANQLCILFVVAWPTFSVGSVFLAVFSWLRLCSCMFASWQMTDAPNKLNPVVRLLSKALSAEHGYVINTGVGMPQDNLDAIPVGDLEKHLGGVSALLEQLGGNTNE